MIEPLAVGMHAVKKAGSLLGQNVVVVGAGTIGLCTIMCAKAAGAAQVIALKCPVHARPRPWKSGPAT